MKTKILISSIENIYFRIFEIEFFFYLYPIRNIRTPKKIGSNVLFIRSNRSDHESDPPYQISMNTHFVHHVGITFLSKPRTKNEPLKIIIFVSPTHIHKYLQKK